MRADGSDSVRVSAHGPPPSASSRPRPRRRSAEPAEPAAPAQGRDAAASGSGRRRDRRRRRRGRRFRSSSSPSWPPSSSASSASSRPASAARSCSCARRARLAGRARGGHPRALRRLQLAHDRALAGRRRSPRRRSPSSPAAARWLIVAVGVPLFVFAFFAPAQRLRAPLRRVHDAMIERDERSPAPEPPRRRMQLTGLHHVTLICRDLDADDGVLPRPARARAGPPGHQRRRPRRAPLLVRRRRGSPGTLVTFLEYPRCRPASVGTGSTHHFALRRRVGRGAGRLARLPAQPRRRCTDVLRPRGVPLDLPPRSRRPHRRDRHAAGPGFGPGQAAPRLATPRLGSVGDRGRRPELAAPARCADARSATRPSCSPDIGIAASTLRHRVIAPAPLADQQVGRPSCSRPPRALEDAPPRRPTSPWATRRLSSARASRTRWRAPGPAGAAGHGRCARQGNRGGGTHPTLTSLSASRSGRQADGGL